MTGPAGPSGGGVKGLQMRCMTTGLLAQDCDHCKRALTAGCTCGHDGLGPEWHATGCPQGEPAAVPPGGEELRDLVVRNRELEAKLRRVKELAHSWEHPLRPDHHWYADRLRRALAGES